MAGDWKRWLPLGGAGDAEETRVLDLVLDLPGRRGEPNRKQARELLEAIDYWSQLIGHPIVLLRRIEQVLKRINTEAIDWTTHQQVVNRALAFACAAIRKVYQDQSAQDALPESHDRREGLSVAISTAHQLAVGLMQHLDRDYHLPVKRYLEQRERIVLSALRVLELVYLEQRLRALRYQKLPRTTWQDINRLFFCFYASGDVEALLPGQNCLLPQPEPSISGMNIKSPMTTLQQVFVTIHLLGLMDINTLSSRHLASVDELLNSAAAKADMLTDDQQALEAGRLIVYYGQACPAYYVRQDDIVPDPPRPFSSTRNYPAGPAPDQESAATLAQPLPSSLKIDISWLTTMLPTHHSELVSQLRANMRQSAGAQDKTGELMIDLAQLATVDTMCKRLSRRQRGEAREYIIGNKVLHLVNGYMPVYQMLVKQTQSASKSPNTSGVELREALAGRSNLVDWDNTSAEMGQWLVMDASPGGIHIRTPETPFTTGLYIGQLLIFSYSLEGLRYPSLGFVTRLNRFVAGEIEVIIQVLTERPRAATVQSDELSEKSMALPGVLLLASLQTAGEEHQSPAGLVLHQSHRLAPSTRVRVKANGRTDWFYLGDLASIQREFLVYTLQRDELGGAGLLNDGC